MGPLAHFIVATAGHVDHGKSALVKALTGTDPDRLPEEKARAISIELGFAHLDLPAPSVAGPAASILRVGLIDVPGHEDFVKNMIAGVGSIDAALFIVAADDGWMPQTEEHLQILSYLGVRRAVVALTKIDLVPGREADVEARLREQLRATPFAQAPIVPTSILSGRGLAELRNAIAAVLSALPAPRDLDKPRLPIDRVFILRGIGTVVTGTLAGGTFRRNQAVVIEPGGIATRIRSLQNHNQEVEAIAAGTRTASSLADVTPADASGGVARGQVVTVPELSGASQTLDVLVEKSARLLEGTPIAARPLTDGTRVVLHHGSAHVPARVILLDRTPLAPGQRALAQLRLEQPLFALAGDRFILRDWAQQRTLAGGLILEVEAHRKSLRTDARRAFLRTRADAPEDPAAWTQAQLQRDHAVLRTELLRRTHFGGLDIEAAVARLAAGNQVFLAGGWLLQGEWWREMNQSAAEAIRAYHREHPERPGLPLNDLRRLLEDQLPEPSVFDVLLAQLAPQGFLQVGTVLRQTSHRPSLPPQLESAGARLRAVLAAKPFEPPARKDLVTDALAQQALRFLLETGEAIEVAPDLVMLREHFGRARELICQRLQERGPGTASDLRQLLGTNRRVIIPLLERLDRDGVTQRQGDQRALRAR